MTTSARPRLTLWPTLILLAATWHAWQDAPARRRPANTEFYSRRLGRPKLIAIPYGGRCSKLFRSSRSRISQSAARVALGKRRAGAAITLLRLGDQEACLNALRVTDDPESLTQFVHRCRDRDVTPAELIQCLDKVQSLRKQLSGDQRRRHDAVQYALLLAPGEFKLVDLPEAQRQPLVDRLVNSYATDPSSAVHGACGWLLRHWGFQKEATRVDHTPLDYDPTGERDWFVQEVKSQTDGLFGTGIGARDLRIYFTFVVFPPSEYVMGSSVGEVDRKTDEELHQVEITHRLAVSDRELTWEQFNAAGMKVPGGTTHQETWSAQFKRDLVPQGPAFGVNWFEAVDYCRWLTAQVGMSEVQQCYADKETLETDTDGNPVDWRLDLTRPGFRLLTEAEWEYVCRSDTRTRFSFGCDEGLLGRYAWYADNSKRWSHVVGELRPNPRGLLDIHGNLHEWCHDWHGKYEVSPAAARDPLGALRALTGWPVAGAGVCSPGSAGRRAVSGTTRPTGATSWDSASPAVCLARQASRRAEPRTEAINSARRSPDLISRSNGGASAQTSGAGSALRRTRNWLQLRQQPGRRS